MNLSPVSLRSPYLSRQAILTARRQSPALHCIAFLGLQDYPSGVSKDMKTDMEIVATTEFRRDLIIYFFSLLGWTIFQIIIAFTLEPSAERAGLPAPMRIALPIATAFFIATVASLAIGKWTTAPVIRTIRARIEIQGSLSDNRSSIFSDFGFNIYFGVLLGISILGQDICKWTDIPTASRSIEGTLSCYLSAEITMAILAGLGVGFVLWIYFRVRQFEGTANTKIMVQRYRARSWSFWIIAGGAGLTYVIIYAFYKIFTLGHQ